MTPWLLIAVLTFSSSIDNLGVGLSYGIRNIQISLLSNLLIAVICFLFSAGGIYFGMWISELLPGIFPILLGAFILAIIGVRIMLLARPNRNASSKAPDSNETPGLKSVMKDPTTADIDNSQSIGFLESIFLGVALSANALTNGIGAGLLGLSPILISVLAAAGSFVTVWIGVASGIKLSHVRIGKYSVGQFGTLISGALLLVVACMAFLD
ncbi:sporulation membrane protein YtaF [Paenibacillaceae bacterium]|nr:sporulation membrane protein YtaF [Paenibacillaceae bacterium]